MAIRPYLQHRPQLGARVYIDPAAQVIGRAELGEDVSIWPYAVVRGDVHEISIGARSNIQDQAVLHVTHDGPYTPGGSPLRIGTDVTVGHGAILHACTVEDACLIGMGAVVLDKAVIGRHSLIGAGSVVSPGKVVEAGSLWVGNPARFVRKLSEREIEQLYYSAENYRKLKDDYLGMAG
ncbi:MAG: gamma carbonic anhydrase family protein [Xanthomonadales bacterium]|nr:Protein YrdA [Xanthomonadales bacterium]MCC6594766.1 gamma carbonic anhydrase family protein [Xanthomonadales bacterium]MCE7932827.1 gamma carbonic anhydrase family protein [Xanthomonadales bacterium PRO6]